MDTYEEARQKLVEVYGQTAWQLVGVVLSFSVAAYGVLQLPSLLASVIPQGETTRLVFSLLVTIVAEAGYFLLNAMFWVRMVYGAIGLTPSEQTLAPHPMAAIHKECVKQTYKNNKWMQWIRLGEATVLKGVAVGLIFFVVTFIVI